ncbi:DUF2142 domain-containing protein [Streptococcus equinus]|uniref:DUF2142 domain-containing protein n=1 Tax=Streptococcus equinus TaxID=1335 RepID=UPI0005F7E335|nr:DUF2142 domain-containing protein [Streptococcus equinus]QMS95731.1 DUF2142 domain-containing protein [Streptococcus equinus]
MKIKRIFSKCFRPENFFLVIALIFGIVFLKIFPPLTAPDELGHFAKAYAFSEGKVVPVYHHSKSNPFSSWNNYGFYLPDDLNDLNEDTIEVVMNSDLKFDYNFSDNFKYKKSKLEFTGLGGQMNYSFVQYIPQILGIFLAKLFSSSVLLAYFSAKLFNFIFYLVIVYFAIKAFKFSKWAAVLFALNPMLLELATSASGDAFTDAISFLFTALLSKLIIEDKSTKRILFLSFILLIMMVQMKPTLILFGMLYFIIPLKKLNLKLKIIYGSVVFIVSVLIYLLWGRLFPSQEIMYQDFTSSSEQLRFILKSPLEFLRVIHNTLKEHGEFLYLSFSGQLSALNRNLPIGIIKFYYLIIVVTCLIDSPKYEESNFTIYKRFDLLVMIVGYIVLTFIALFQIWTPVGSDSISGLQGRYFIPLSFVFIMVLGNSKIKFNNFFVKIIPSVAITVILIISSVVLAKSYGIF